jgi:hypothetical protein
VLAKALSHRDMEEVEAMALCYPSFQLFDDLCQELASTTDLRALLDVAAVGTKGPGWHAQDNLIIANDRIYLSVSSPCL